MRMVDLTNERFTRLVVVSRGQDIIEKSGRKRITWVCKCDCGNVVQVRAYALCSGNTTSCGCRMKDIVGKIKRTHGKTGSSEYVAWGNMISRCYDKNRQNYKNYGGRGITVCKRWRTSFENFLFDMGEKPDTYSIERIDNDGNYTPSNCKWIPQCEQQLNKRNTLSITYKGTTMSIVKWASLLGVPKSRLKERMYLGWCSNDIIEIPKNGRSNKCCQ